MQRAEKWLTSLLAFERQFALFLVGHRGLEPRTNRL